MNQAQHVRAGPVCLSPDSLTGLGRGLSGVSTRSRMATGWSTSTCLDPQRQAQGSDLLKPVPALSPAHGFLPLVTPSLLSLQFPHADRNPVIAAHVSHPVSPSHPRCGQGPGGPQVRLWGPKSKSARGLTPVMSSPKPLSSPEDPLSSSSHQNPRTPSQSLELLRSRVWWWTWATMTPR